MLPPMAQVMVGLRVMMMALISIIDVFNAFNVVFIIEMMPIMTTTTVVLQVQRLMDVLVFPPGWWLQVKRHVWWLVL